MDLRLALMCGSPIPFPEGQLTIHQPRMEEIAMIGEEDFFTGAQCFCVDKNLFIEDESVLSQINNFQIFMTVMNEKEAQDKKYAVIQFLSLLFPAYKINFTPRSIILQGQEGVSTIDETNFDTLQELVKELCCLKSTTSQKILNPSDRRAKEIADKIMRGRQKVAQEKGTDKASIFGQYISILVIGTHTISPSEANQLTMYQLYDYVERFQLNMEWDIDIRSRLAGAKPSTQVENWMKNIH